MAQNAKFETGCLVFEEGNAASTTDGLQVLAYLYVTTSCSQRATRSLAQIDACALKKHGVLPWRCYVWARTPLRV